MKFTTCRCEAYTFPHAPLGGRCRGYWMVEQVFEDGRDCDGCQYFRSWTEKHDEGPGEPMALCRVLDEDLKADRCPGIEVIKRSRTS